MEKVVRAACYARVSSEEQTEGYSIDAQRRAFQVYCHNKGWLPYHEYIEEGKSAYTEDLRKRPVFKEALEDAMAGKYDVLVVHKIDRFSRKLKITLECFEKLGKAGVGFVSIQNDIDYSTPTGKFSLVLQGGLAELYSDNLSEETKKGWHERRKQGLYCGHLPFGAMKDQNGIPVPDSKTYPGLELAFKMAAEGKNDREVAQALDSAGYRTVGTQGNFLFTKDSVRGMLKNRFYIGEIPDGNGGWMKAKHKPFIAEDIFYKAQNERDRRRYIVTNHVKNNARIYSLSGLIYCKGCGSKMHIHQNNKGKARVYCGNKAKGFTCNSNNTFLEVYESQIEWYLQNFTIPQDYQRRILDSYKQLEGNYEEVTKKRDALNRRLLKIKELYEWEHIDKTEYLSRYNSIKKELSSLVIPENRSENLERLAKFLQNVALAWKEANQEQRSIIVNTLFEQIWIDDYKVIEVKPRKELKPFFQLSYEEYLEKSTKRPLRDLNPRSPP